MNILVYCRQIQAVKNPIAVSYRNAELIAEALGADLLMYKEDKLKQVKYDAIILTYTNRYTDYKTLEDIILRDNPRQYLLQTEYEPVVVSYKYNKGLQRITNFENKKWPSLNTNLLIARPPNPIQHKKYDCVYYSRHRADRMKYCVEYLQGDVYLSTHPKNHKHFYHAGCRPKLIKHLDWTHGRETLNQFRYSLYMEDVYTHSVFNNLANRWYEAGFCNNVVFFDANCENTIRKSEIGYYWEQVKDYVVSSHAELMERIQECNKDWERHLAIQKSWRAQELQLRTEMIAELKRIITSE